MSYSKDLREKVLAHIDLGATLEDASKYFSVGLASIKRWRKNKRETGNVMGPGRPTGPYKICEDKLKNYIEENPDAFLDEIASNFNVTPPAILFALKRLKITRKKKSTLYKERCEKKRKIYIKEVSQLPLEKLVYVDESGIDTFISREYGRGTRGERVYGEKSGRRFARESFVAGLRSNKTIAPFCYSGTMDSELFNYWLVNYLIPDTSPGDIIIMDNAAFHKSEKTRDIIKASKCNLVFLPPYSPDLNPIEKFWANFKANVKKYISKFATLADTIDAVFRKDHLNFN